MSGKKRRAGRGFGGQPRVLVGWEWRGAYLVEGHRSLDAVDVLVELAADVLKVLEEEGPVNVKPTGDDVLGVLPGEPLGLLDAEASPQHLLVVRQLDHERHLEGVLQVLCEHEWNQVAQV